MNWLIFFWLHRFQKSSVWTHYKDKNRFLIDTFMEFTNLAILVAIRFILYIWSFILFFFVKWWIHKKLDWILKKAVLTTCRNFSEISTTVRQFYLRIRLNTFIHCLLIDNAVRTILFNCEHNESPHCQHWY